MRRLAALAAIWLFAACGTSETPSPQDAQAASKTCSEPTWRGPVVFDEVVFGSGVQSIQAPAAPTPATVEVWPCHACSLSECTTEASLPADVTLVDTMASMYGVGASASSDRLFEIGTFTAANAIMRVQVLVSGEAAKQVVLGEKLEVHASVQAGCHGPIVAAASWPEWVKPMGDRTYIGYVIAIFGDLHSTGGICDACLVLRFDAFNQAGKQVAHVVAARRLHCHEYGQ